MGYALKIYEAFKDDEHKAAILAEAFESLETKYANLDDVATNSQLKVTEAILKQDLEVTKIVLQKELKETELRLQKEIEGVRLEIKDAEIRLQKQIGNFFKWSFSFWLTQLIAIGGLLFAFIKMFSY